MPEALGEKIMTSPPRSLRMRSWLSSTLARSSSSLTCAIVTAAASAPEASAASWASRNACSWAGAVV